MALSNIKKEILSKCGTADILFDGESFPYRDLGCSNYLQNNIKISPLINIDYQEIITVPEAVFLH